MVYVDREFRRRGIGSALVRHMEQSCKTAKLFTSTNRSNKPMQALLDKLGYQPSGVIENLDEGDPELVYVKRVRIDVRCRLLQVKLLQPGEVLQDVAQLLREHRPLLEDGYDIRT